MRLILLTTSLLLLLNTKQVFSKIHRGSEIQKLQERLPVKNYITVQDNENRKVNKYKDDLSEESEEIFEENTQKQFSKKKQKEIKMEQKRTYNGNLKTPRFSTKRNADQSDEEVIGDRKSIKNKEYLEKGPRKYNIKQRNEKSLNEKGNDNDFPGRIKQKPAHGSYEEKSRKSSINGLKLRKSLMEDNESSQDYENEQDGKSREIEETDEEDISLDNDDSLQCDSLDDENCDDSHI
ncbi:hypothetical protein ILUMI_06603 [Ignelater luminosus]|uniref:Uncharacterized protein n=1 Tax=Ignelater luminosus TaxID=2038154 RepID=A0A8K0D5F6_IGNLU|nr:hypothetical protein ILUMI_06603 [Ignelater luminosus]